MAKVKTKKIVAKRFRVTATGKLMHRTQGKRHIRRRKDKSQQRRQDRDRVLDATMAKKVKVYLPGR